MCALMIGVLALVVMANACTPGGCEFYDCMEKAWPCGKDGYVLDYGKFYCNAFTNATRRFSVPEGQAWVTATRLCLQETLWQEAMSLLSDSSTATPSSSSSTTSRRCAMIREIALESHSKCYTSPAAGISVCSVLSDWPAIISIASGVFLYDVKVALSQASETVLYCINLWLFGSERGHE